MDSQRLILLLVFGFSLVMLWNGWEKQYHAQPAAQTQQSRSGGQQSPAGSGAAALPTPQASLANVPPSAAATPSVGETALVHTDLFVARISAVGGNLVKLELTKQKATKDKSKNFVLLEQDAERTYVAQSGLIGDDLPNHKTEFKLPGKSFTLQPGADTLQIRLEAPETDGVKVEKTYTFHRGSYLIDVGYQIVNGGNKPIAPNAYFQMERDSKLPLGESSRMASRFFTGPAVYTKEGKYQKIKFEDIAKNDAKYVHDAKDGWVAMVQHYFVSAWLPAAGVGHEFFVRKVGDDLYTAGVIVPVAKVAPGQTVKIDVPLYAGPQEQDKLAKIAPGLDLVVDYGWLTIIAAPLFWVLQKLHLLVGNWGWAIILLTIILKLIFFPLSAASYKSMAKMRLVTPRLTKLKEQYGKDKARLNQEMMELYKKEKINPLGGCLPIVIQIPVFFALYYVLLSTVEMRHAPWIGWITDLSARDPYYVLPIVMGLTMILQTRLNPTPPDPIQAKVMMAMPIVFTFMFLWFPSGLVLYWTVNNLLSIAQQWQITRLIEGGRRKPA